MGALIDVIAEGIKQFGGEIVAGVLFAVALWMFPSLRKFFGRKDDSAEEVKEELAKLKGILNESLKKDSSEEELQKQLDILKQEEEQLAHLKGVLQRNDEALRQAETQTAEESRRKEDIQRQLEEQRREEERVKAEIQRKQEELRKAEEKRAEEARLKAELERQREEKRREEERIRAEIQRKQEALRQAEARKAEEARQREELQRQLEAMKESSKARSSDNWGCTFRKVAFYAVPLFFAVCVFVATRPFYSVEAQRELGDKYYHAKDSTMALYWYRKAAANGDVETQKKLVSMFCMDKTFWGRYAVISIDIDKAEATKWWTKAIEHYRQAAERGDAQAQFDLGDMYYDVFLRTMDDDPFPKAAKWYRKAAEQGHTEAQYKIGLIYYYGEGVN